ncbi:NADP-dependent oxidoreductase [Nesterenkonia muleiensis]|uniref:NADP-dependent oxidoreductase n=1 Tax=Nesterenkonia muleiensis TaxID=2282648 RepID=UPI000E7220EA|nr:NADP-dependent oxidoreductase [Nesterenkonia muleiensis]
MTMENQMPTSMRAAQADAFGDPPVLKVRDVPLRPPRSDRAVVRMLATTVNPLDLEARRGELRALRRPPIGTGLDVAGHIVAAGKRWKGPPVGTPVWGALGGLPVKKLMAAAEYVEVRSGWVVEAPTRIPLTEAAALPVAALTAHLGLRSLRLRPGARVLIRGASGGVGTAAIQIARHLGAHVIALCSPRNNDLCLSLGAQETVDYHSLDWNSLAPVDAAFDIVGGDDLKRLTQVVQNGGRVSAAVPDRPGLIVASVLPGRTSIRPVLALPSRRHLNDLASLIDLGHLAPVVAQRFPLAQIAEAHHHLETDPTPGKRIIDIVT